MGLERKVRPGREDLSFLLGELEREVSSSSAL